MIESLNQPGEEKMRGVWLSTSLNPLFIELVLDAPLSNTAVAQEGQTVGEHKEINNTASMSFESRLVNVP